MVQVAFHKVSPTGFFILMKNILSSGVLFTCKLSDAQRITIITIFRLLNDLDRIDLCLFMFMAYFQQLMVLCIDNISSL